MKIKELTKEEMQRHKILEVISGSRAFGLSTEESDTDIRGVIIPPFNILLGLDYLVRDEVRYESKDDDRVYYTLEKFVSLALSNNPAIFDILFVEKDSIISINEYGKSLLSVRDKFLSKKVYHTYGGYAYSQFQRMTMVGKEAEGKRKESIDKYGYDTKNAMHLVRLMLMCKEILSEGKVIVNRGPKQRDFLLGIRNGKHSLDSIVSLYEDLKEEIREASIKTDLPEYPDYGYINNWLWETQEKFIINYNFFKKVLV